MLLDKFHSFFPNLRSIWKKKKIKVISGGVFVCGMLMGHMQASNPNHFHIPQGYLYKIVRNKKQWNVERVAVIESNNNQECLPEQSNFLIIENNEHLFVGIKNQKKDFLRKVSQLGRIKIIPKKLAQKLSKCEVERLVFGVL